MKFCNTIAIDDRSHNQEGVEPVHSSSPLLGERELNETALKQASRNIPLPVGSKLLQYHDTIPSLMPSIPHTLMYVDPRCLAYKIEKDMVAK